MIADLTDYARSLGPGGEPPGEGVYSVARELLREKLVREMVRRGLLSAPPRFLGIATGGRFWTAELIDELVSDCYVELFLLRLEGLKNQLLVRADVDGVITRGVRNFLHDLQRANDPLGYQVYEILAARLKELADRGTLRVERRKKGGKIHNGSVVVFGSRPPPLPVPAVDLDARVRAWNAELWPDLVTARGRGRRKVLDRLDACLASLPESGVDAFIFKDLVEPMKSDVRGRWREELAELAESMSSTGDFPADLDFRKLRDCVAGKLEKESRGAREDLRKLWLFLWTYAAGLETSAVADKAERGGKPPTDLGLENELGITRHRLSGLKETLGRMIRDCRASAVSPKAAVSKLSEDADAMSPNRRREELRRATGEAAARWAARRAEIERDPRAPRPGDTVVLATSGDLLVEWVVLEEDPDDGRLLVVPADDRPDLGAHDLAVSSESAAVASVRCASGGWLPARALDGKLRTGTLAPEVLDRVRRKRSAAEATESAGDGSRQDPTYRDHMAELAALEAALLGPPLEPPLRFRARKSRSRRASLRLGVRESRLRVAAALIALAVGLGGGVVWQRWRLEGVQEGKAHPNLPVAWLTAGESVRGEEDPVLVPRDARRLALIFEVSSPEVYSRYRVEVRAGSEEVWASDELVKRGSEVSFDLPRSSLETGSYEVRILGLAAPDGDEDVLLEEYAFWIELQ